MKPSSNALAPAQSPVWTAKVKPSSANQTLAQYRGPYRRTGSGKSRRYYEYERNHGGEIDVLTAMGFTSACRAQDGQIHKECRSRKDHESIEGDEHRSTSTSPSRWQVDPVQRCLSWSCSDSPRRSTRPIFMELR